MLGDSGGGKVAVEHVGGYALRKQLVARLRATGIDKMQEDMISRLRSHLKSLDVYENANRGLG